MLEADKANFAAYHAELLSFQAKIRAGQLDDAKTMLADGGAFRDTGQKFRGGLTSHIDYNVKVAHELRDENNAAYSQAFWLLVACMVAAVAVTGGLGLQLYRSITSGLSLIQRKIKDLIGESVTRVDAGSKLVEEAGTTINEIVESVKRVADIVGEISSASEEQRTGIEQVNQAVVQMDQGNS
jgi:hypothetical protein